MGECMISGPQALDLVQRISSNDASVLTPGKAIYSCMPNSTGGIVDDLIIYKMAENDYMLVVNGANIDKDFDWIKSQNTFDAQLTNASDEWSLLALQGPAATEVLQPLTDTKLADIPYYILRKALLKV